MRQLLCILLLLCSQLVQAYSTQQLKQFNRVVSQQALKLMRQYKVMGMSMALVNADSIVWEGNFGYANLAQNIPANRHTIYRVGSVSKTLVASAIMQLAAQGKLQLQDPINKYIPELCIANRFADTTTINIQQLLSHHAGIPSDVLAHFFSTNPPPFQSIITYLNEESLIAPPNTIHAYSNAAYSLLGVIIERASQQDFHAYMEEHFFAPLQMSQSAFYLKKAQTNNYALGYKNKRAQLEPALRDVPAGMLHTSLQDLANYAQMYLNKGKFEGQQVLLAQDIAQMHSPQNTHIPLDFDLQMGLSWFIDPYVDARYSHAGPVISHGGDTQLYHVKLSFLPQQNLALIILTNSAKGHRLIKSLHSKTMVAALKYLQKYTPIVSPKHQYKVNKYNAVSAQQLSAYAGDYAVATKIYTLHLRKGKLETKLGANRVQLKMIGPQSFQPVLFVAGIPIKLKKQQLNITQINNDTIVSITKNGVQKYIGIKTIPNKVPIQWKQAASYYINNDSSSVMGKQLQLNYSKNYILLKIKLYDNSVAQIYATPISDTQAVVVGLGRSAGQSIFLSKKNASYQLQYSGMHFIQQRQ